MAISDEKIIELIENVSSLTATVESYIKEHEKQHVAINGFIVEQKKTNSKTDRLWISAILLIGGLNIGIALLALVKWW
jgi:ABC-type microcin C transport system permease subunit YejE